MGGSTFGNNFRVTTFGESHGLAIGVIVDGCPAGISLNEERIQPYLNRRKPGQTVFSTSRKEQDKVQILSGVFEGKTTGTPLCLMIENEEMKSEDYSEISHVFRPGHADFTYERKFGIRDYRGGGRSSGRETAARVAAGAVASLVLKELSVDVFAYTRSIGSCCCSSKNDYLYQDFFSLQELQSSAFSNPLCIPNAEVTQEAEQLISSLRAEGDSVGGTIECVIQGLPAGLGEPVFDKFDALLAKAMLSIGGVKGFEIGSGFLSSRMTGSAQNDSFFKAGNGKIQKETNHAGGILGGITDGSDICFRVAIKPTPSIQKLQKTITKEGIGCDLSVRGRHDPVIVPRAVVVVESMAALVAVDLFLSGSTSRIENIKKIFET